MIIEVSLKQLREFKGLSQKYMALKLNMSQPTYSNIERDLNRTSIENYEIISSILGISLENAIKHKVKMFVYIYNDTYPSNEKETIERALIILQEQNTIISKIHSNLFKMKNYNI